MKIDTRKVFLWGLFEHEEIFCSIVELNNDTREWSRGFEIIKVETKKTLRNDNSLVPISRQEQATLRFAILVWDQNIHVNNRQES
ncbi:CLUMA_CG018585, isoform A [Clunio marinus]|uniref:CLUMA_CG018585, isoform A n=1 Tax=Clunio marinus TaxID=568069 RepID=A0A1J1IXJ2_9DIPT|nr:CLUMA_CG018585, isoform A [Clunio marinus]